MINRQSKPKTKLQFTKVVDPKKKDVFYPVGEKLIVNGKVCKVVEDKFCGYTACVKCEICVSNDLLVDTATCVNVLCSDIERVDGKSVHFEKLS